MRGEKSRAMRTWLRSNRDPGSGIRRTASLEDTHITTAVEWNRVRRGSARLDGVRLGSPLRKPHPDLVAPCRTLETLVESCRTWANRSPSHHPGSKIDRT